MNKDRKNLIRDLDNDLVMLYCNKKYELLSYLDIIEALIRGIADCLRWHRKRNGYRKLKGVLE